MREIIGDYEEFIRNISDGLTNLGIDRSEIAMMDHLCYRVETQDRYKHFKTLMSGRATLLTETEVSGRNISTFEFNDYLAVDDWVVPYLELPEPKKGSPYPEGLEHAELVVIGSLDRFIGRHRDLDFDHKAMGRGINRELVLKTKSISVKFHEQSLGSVIAIEKSLAQLK